MGYKLSFTGEPFSENCNVLRPLLIMLRLELQCRLSVISSGLMTFHFSEAQVDRVFYNSFFWEATPCLKFKS